MPETFVFLLRNLVHVRRSSRIWYVINFSTLIAMNLHYRITSCLCTKLDFSIYTGQRSKGGWAASCNLTFIYRRSYMSDHFVLKILNELSVTIQKDTFNTFIFLKIQCQWDLSSYTCILIYDVTKLSRMSGLLVEELRLESFLRLCPKNSKSRNRNDIQDLFF